DVGGPGTVAVDQHEYLALEVTPLAIRGCAADVDRGLTGRPFAEKTEGVLGEQVGDRFRGRALDFGAFDDLNRADHTAALAGASQVPRRRRLANLRRGCRVRR